jgi:hypothetical protein
MCIQGAMQEFQSNPQLDKFKSIIIYTRSYRTTPIRDLFRVR